MAKKPKFLIAKNPMAEPDGVYIFHTQIPRFLAKTEGILIEVIDDIDDMVEHYNGDTRKIAGLLKRTNAWYKAYRIHLKNEETNNNRPFYNKN